MTGASCGIFRRRCESRKTSELPWRQPGSPTLHGRTSRNVNRHGRACRHPETTRTNNLCNITPKSKDAVVCSFLDSGKWTRSEVVSARARTGVLMFDQAGTYPNYSFWGKITRSPDSSLFCQRLALFATLSSTDVYEKQDEISSIAMIFLWVLIGRLERKLLKIHVRCFYRCTYRTMSYKETC